MGVYFQSYTSLGGRDAQQKPGTEWHRTEGKETILSSYLSALDFTFSYSYQIGKGFRLSDSHISQQLTVDFNP